MTKQLEALIAEMKAAAELIADGYRCEFEVIHDPENGVARLGCLDDDGELSSFVEVSVSNYSGDERHDAELADFFVKSHPANVLALIAALEQSEQKLSEIISTPFSVDMSPGAVIPGAMDAWGRKVPQFLPYDFSGNPGASATQYCNGWNDAGGYWANNVNKLTAHIAELEASPLAVKLPKRGVGEVMHISGFSRDYAEGWCAGNDNAIHEIRAAGGTVSEGE